ncbi:aspartate aminotransferase, putative [Roseovarius sp. TM1035]|jgi:arginine:pyruvate transaminase|uniref:pyridoxal phosphate-dependent aminotransferase n=1 Tax=Roseovarius sp. TM1035 TaxID=391613 RepID=UPI00015575A6|nr:pyridoxal phosphate-dependent aminotransferase [Roseovarius sp. TM1035]AWZ18857.1 Aspartate aminotransferase [Roseovarius sp. AK1035]EDM32504.1 aspartate aminotransferase, putative [Roseovarius sp. TM1035]
MRFSSINERLAGLGGAKWEVHARAKDMARAGRDVIRLTIGEPDVPTPERLKDAAYAAMKAGRTGYSDGRGEPGLRAALAEKYSKNRGRAFHPDQVMCFPGTQTALYAVMMAVAEEGAEVLVGDPMYATYEGVIRATGAAMVPVPLRPENGFRMAAADVAARITPRTRAILLTTPHNPTGAILTREDIAALGQLAVEHDLWIISDEVYEDLVFEGSEFVSPLSDPDLAERVVAVSSISKSHAAPGFRSGWCVGSLEFTANLLALSETMLFGNQPFIADMTEQAVREGSDVAAGMRQRFAARAELLAARLERETALRVHRPEAGMFAMVDIAATGLDGESYAFDLLEKTGVAVMPGASFGKTLDTWVRLALTVEDAPFAQAIDRIVAHANARHVKIA